MKHPKSYDTTPETSERMSHVHLKQGKAEVLLAKRLWHFGFRYRLNDKRLPGSPDIAILKYRIAIFGWRVLARAKLGRTQAKAEAQPGILDSQNRGKYRTGCSE